MKKLLDNNLFVGILIAAQVVFVIASVLIAIYDDGHASIVPLIMVIAVSFVFNVFLAVLSIVLNGTKKWYYIGPVLFWVFLLALLCFQNFEDDYDEMEEAEIEQMMLEDNLSTIRNDSIQADSIR